MRFTDEQAEGCLLRFSSQVSDGAGIRTQVSLTSKPVPVSWVNQCR